MKARTRILAMLLTLLMVGGMLPLALFADDGTNQLAASDVVQAKPADRTFEAVKEEFSKAKLNLSLYQSFDNWEFEEGKTEYYFPVDASSLQPIGDNAEMGSENLISIKNGKGTEEKGAYSIVTEPDGNKALYLGYAPLASSGNDNLIDVYFDLPSSYTGQQGNGSHDFYIEADFKMNGPNISQALGDNGLFGLLYRVGGLPNILPTVTVSNIGALYIGGVASPDALIGYLSSEEYTKVAVSIDRASNSFYVYINDILINADGTELFSDEIVDRLNSSNNTGNGVTYTAQNFPICNVRMYNVSDNATENDHKGLFIDNVITGTRMAVEPKNVAYQDIFTAQFPKALAGTNLSIPVQGTTSSCDGVVYEGAIKYIQEADGTVAMQWQNTPGPGDATHQAYLNINSNAGKGANVRLSMDVKMGPEGVLGGEFASFRTRVDNAWNFHVKLDAKGNLSIDGKILGTLKTDAYSNFTVDIVCNPLDGQSVNALFFFDGKMVYSKKLSFKIASGDAPTAFDCHQVRIYSLYNGKPANLTSNDVTIKALSYTVTTDYNNAGAISVFNKKNEGFVENAKITRYYDEKGDAKFENFDINGEKYIVGYNNIIIGKESDGVEFTPYARYEDWTHENLIKSSPEGDVLVSGNEEDGVPQIGSGRDSFWTDALDPNTGDIIKLYTSYYDSTASGEDHNSCTEWFLPEELKSNTSAVFDFDIMMDAFGADKNTVTQQNFFYFVGYNAEAARRDTMFLHMSSDGWFIHEGQKLFKVGRTEYTRVSVVINAPTVDTAGSFDLYANGVQVLAGVPMSDAIKTVGSIRFFCSLEQDLSFYTKNIALYESAKPQKFIDAETKTLTNDQNKTPAKASDFKQGFVTENGVNRYYNTNGHPMAAIDDMLIFTDENGREYKSDINGIVYSATNVEIQMNPGHYSVDYNMNFNGIASGDYGYSAAPYADTERIFGLTFVNNPFVNEEYDEIKLDVYLPSEGRPDSAKYSIELGETQRFYKVEWLGGTEYKFGDGTYFVDDYSVPFKFSTAAAAGTYTLQNARGGESDILYKDTDDIIGISRGDEFYVKTRNVVNVLEDIPFSELSDGWNTIDIPIVHNGSFDIDYLAFVADTDVSKDYIKLINVATVKLVKTTRFVVDFEAEDGVSADGSYFKDGIAQTGWIDVNESASIDAGDYYANPDNAKIITGIYSIGGVWYQFDTDGKLIGLANGLLSVKNGFDGLGNTFYTYKMFESGVIKTGLIDTGLKDGEEKIYIYTNANGVSLQNNETVVVDGATYGFRANGYGMLLCADADAHTYGDGVISGSPTCQTKGAMMYICTKCGNTKHEDIEIDPNKHITYDSKGYATCCTGNVKADGVTALFGYSITIGTKVSVEFYFDITGTEGELEIGRRSQFIADTTEKVKLTDLENVTVGEKTYKKVSVKVAPTAVDSIVTVRYIKADGTYGSVYSYNVQQYIDAVAAYTPDETITAEVKTLVKAFDEIAKNISKVEYGTGTPENITDVNETSFVSKYDVQFNYNEKNTETNYIRLEKTYENIQIVFGETLKLKANFAVTGVSSDFTYYVNGEEVTATLTDSGYYCVEIDVKAEDLDKLITVTVKHAGGSELNLNTSVLSFAKRKLMSNFSSPDEKNLMKAIYKYSVAIDAFLAPDEAE